MEFTFHGKEHQLHTTKNVRGSRMDIELGSVDHESATVVKQIDNEMGP